MSYHKASAGRFEAEAFTDGWPISVIVHSGHPNERIRIQGDDIPDLVYALQRLAAKIDKAQPIIPAMLKPLLGDEG